MSWSVTPTVTPEPFRLLPGRSILAPWQRSPKGKHVATADGSFTVNGKAANGEGWMPTTRWLWRATYRRSGWRRPSSRVRGRTRGGRVRRRAEAIAARVGPWRPPTPAGTRISPGPRRRVRAVVVAQRRCRLGCARVVSRAVRRSGRADHARLGDVRLGALTRRAGGHVADGLLGTLSASTVTAHARRLRRSSRRR